VKFIVQTSQQPTNSSRELIYDGLRATASPESEDVGHEPGKPKGSLGKPPYGGLPSPFELRF
jgi:hypothetical protein